MIRAETPPVWRPAEAVDASADPSLAAHRSMVGQTNDRLILIRSRNFRQRPFHPYLVESKVVLEKTAYGVTILRGRTEEEWLVVPWWPCSGEAIRTIAPTKLPHK